MSADAKAVIIKGRPLSCGHCGAQTFYGRVIVMPGPAASVFGFAAVSPRASCYVCSECTFVHLFADEGGDPRRRPA